MTKKQISACWNLTLPRSLSSTFPSLIIPMCAKIINGIKKIKCWIIFVLKNWRKKKSSWPNRHLSVWDRHRFISHITPRILIQISPLFYPSNKSAIIIIIHPKINNNTSNTNNINHHHSKEEAINCNSNNYYSSN